MALEGIASLLTASLDLQLVQLLRAAMAPGGTGAVSPLGPRPTDIQRRFNIQPETEYLQRRHVQPEPRIEPRQVIRPADRFEPSQRDLTIAPGTSECYTPAKQFVIEPPWKVLPWEEPLRCESRPPVKIVIKPPDIVHKGSLIDFFI